MSAATKHPKLKHIVDSAQQFIKSLIAGNNLVLDAARIKELIEKGIELAEEFHKQVGTPDKPAAK